MVGVIVLAMLALYLRRRLRAHEVDVPVHGAPYGVAAGSPPRWPTPPVR